MLLELLAAAAASARPVLEAARPAMEAAAKDTVVLRFGATGAFARQIENGAPFDLFFAADEETPRTLAAKGLLDAATLRLYMEGRLVLVKSRESNVTLPKVIDEAFLGHLPSMTFRKVAIASPLATRTVSAGNVEEALAYVESGNAEIGFVAESLAKRSGLAFASVDASLHSPIRQFAGVVSASKKGAEARRALEAVGSGPANPRPR